MSKTFTIVKIGSTEVAAGCDAIGGDKRLLKVGLTHEIIGVGKDGGPVLLAACPNLQAAQAIKVALEFAMA